MRVLVTGGAGYVGTELVTELARQPAVDSIAVYDNLWRGNHGLFLSEKLAEKPIRFVLGDILDTRKLARAVAEADLVYHLAARVAKPFPDWDPHGFEQINHWGTAELSYALEATPAQRVIYASSTSVYGASALPVDWGTPPNPDTPYAISKLRGEHMLSRLAAKMDVLVVRCGNVYGYSKSMRLDTVLNRFMFEAQFTGRVTIQGSGRQHRPFLHVQSAARALCALGLKGVVPSGSYNLVEKNLSVLDIASHLQALYPRLETLFIQQDLELRNLEVLPDERLEPLELLAPRTLAEELAEFQGRFSFTPPVAE